MTSRDAERLANFFSNNCKDKHGNPSPLDCATMWEGYQLEITKPGCRKCNTKKAIKKVMKLLKESGIELP